MDNKKTKVHNDIEEKLYSILSTNNKDTPALFMASIGMIPESIAEKFNYYLTKFKVNIGESKIDIEIDGTSKKPDNWSGDGLMDFILDFYSTLRFTDNMMIYGIEISYGKPVNFFIGENPNGRRRSFDLKGIDKKVNQKTPSLGSMDLQSLQEMLKT